MKRDTTVAMFATTENQAKIFKCLIKQSRTTGTNNIPMTALSLGNCSAGK